MSNFKYGILVGLLVGLYIIDLAKSTGALNG